MELKLAFLLGCLAASVADRVIAALLWTAVVALLLRWVATPVERWRTRHNPNRLR